MMGPLRHRGSSAKYSEVLDGKGPADERRAKACCAAGFSALLAWLCLYWGVLVLSDVEIYNHALFAAAAHAAAFLVLLTADGAFGRARSVSCGNDDQDSAADVGAGEPFGDKSREARLTAVLCCLSGLLLLAYLVAGGAFLAALASIVFGVASALAGVFWVCRIARARVRFSFTCSVCAMLASMLVCLVLQMAGDRLAIALCIVLPIASIFFAFAEPPASPSKNGLVGDDSPRRQLPWPFLSALVACCVVSELFVGLASDPYAFQSRAVVHWWLVLASAVLFVLFAWSCVSRRADVRAFFLASLAFLLMGLFLFSSGILGSIILPLAMIMAAETCCVALCWATVSLLVRRVGTHVTRIACVGLVLGDGVVARGVGMLVSNNLTLSFPTVATAASALIVIFALFYAFATSATQRGDAVVPVLLDESDDLAGAFLDSFGFTAQEQRVASCIIEGLKYREIAERLELSERTVKFHAKNAFEKVGVTRREDFEQRARDWK